MNKIEEIKQETINQEENTSESIPEQTYKEMSPLRLVLRRFFRSKLSLVGIILIVALFLFSFLGPVVYQKWGEETVDRTQKIQKIETTHTFIDNNGNEITVIQVLEHINEINDYDNPSKEHLLGTDDKGMDIFVRLMYGGRISLTIGFIVVILETLIGILLGG